MQKERWHQVEEIYEEALKNPAEGRAAFLKKACAGDESLRKEVESLLACQSEAKGFIESPALEAAAQDLARDQSKRASAALAGRTFSHYRIIEKLGEGGMGVVYKALDTRLNRPVALKVLPPDKVTDPERKRRFVKEARAASALNHPNIVTIHDIGQAEGVDFIAMEYMAGKTLDRQIPHKGMQIAMALNYAIQMADGLAAAHAAGIIHRDFKPSNVMVSNSGKVKVLDFGLAKLIERAELKYEGSPPADTQETSLGTDEGMILGTAAYMSPEQAQGKKVDSRSDIFSFGAVLYEMVCGRKAFQGDGIASTLAAIIRDEPKPLSGIASGVPAELERIIRRCLRKDPDRRFQAIADVKVELLDLKEELESHRKADQPQRHTQKMLWAASITLVVAAIATATWWRLRSLEQVQPQLTAVPFTTYPGWESNATFSPDGNQVAFQWNGEKEDNSDIYVKSVGSEKPHRLTYDAAPDTNPAWSPDGSYIAFLRQRSSGGFAVFTIPPVGGEERKVYETTYVLKGQLLGRKLAWTPDSKRIVISEREADAKPNEPFVISIATGEKRRLTSPPAGFNGDSDPAFSPDGKTLSFVRMRDYDSQELFLLDLSPEFGPVGEPTPLTDKMPVRYRNFSGHAWSADGREIIAALGHGANTYDLWRVPLNDAHNSKRLELVGGGGSFPAISGLARRMVYQRGFTVYSIWFLDDPGESTKSAVPTRVLSSTEWDDMCQVSPDGKKIAFRSTRSGYHEVCTCNSDGSGFLGLTRFNGPICGSPYWSPDSRWIVFDARPEGQSEIYVVSAEGGPFRRITNHPAEDVLPSWSRDGRWIYFTSNRTGEWQIWKTPAGGGEAIRVTQKGGWYAQESLDGRTLYYGKGRLERGVYRMPAEGGEATMFLPDAIITRFAPSSKGVYYWSPNRALTFLDSLTGRSRVVTVIDKSPSWFLSVFPDGKRILYSQLDQANSDLYLVENFR